MDFKKAFDSIWHEGLFFKLLENKIDGQFYSLIKSLYSNSKCAIKQNNIRTDFFTYSKGVRQGCILSPLLFNIYINEITTLFKNTNSDPFILPNGTELSCLLYVDDLIILSKSKFGLHKCLDKLHSWSKKWLMEVNLKKNQIMIFEKRKTKKAKPIFTLGNEKISVVQEYCYLDIKLNHNGNFALAIKQLSEKALHALYSIRRRLNLHQLNPKSAIKIFDSIISPILLYNAEVWGVYIKNDFNNWDKLPVEKVHLKFCKLYLGVGRKTSNIASRSELGKYPLIINVFKRIFKYVTHLNSLPETTISKQAFLISKDLFIKKCNSFYGKAMDIMKTLNCNRAIPDLDSLTTNLVESCVKDTKENYQRFWRHKLENSSKLTFYTSIKEDYELETYLTTITNSNQRKRFKTQLRL